MATVTPAAVAASTSRRKTFVLRTVVVAVALIALLGVSAFLYDPFFFAQKGTAFYLKRNGIQSHTVVVDGYSIHYYEAIPLNEPNGRPPLLLVHGLGASAGDWTAILPGLAHAGFHVYAPDLLGYGSSSKPRDASFSLAQETQIATHFADAVGLRSFDLGGWSMGGWIALKMTLEQPSRVRRLALFDSAGIYFPFDLPFDIFTPTDKAGVDRLLDIIEPKEHFIQIPGWATPGLIRRYRETGWITLRSFSSMLSGRELLDFRIHQVKQPTLIVWGTEDKLIPYTIGRRMHSQLVNSELVGVPKCGHLAPAECAMQVLPEVIKFFSDDATPTPSERILPSKR